jgi:hypothetical protein
MRIRKSWLASLSFVTLVCAGMALATNLPCAADSEGSGNVDSQKSGSGSAKPTAQVLDPQQFFGESQVGYLAAQQCPEIIAKLFCWCGCDETDSHTSLLDCFTTDHGADCKICTGEALMALKLKKQGKSMAEIQRAVDAKFESEYPFDNPSKTLQQYRAHRLYQGDAKGATTQRPSSAPKLKPGKQVGNCCGNKKTQQPAENS